VGSRVPGSKSLYIDNTALTNMGCDTRALMINRHSYSKRAFQPAAPLGIACHEVLALWFTPSSETPGERLAACMDLFRTLWKPVSTAEALDESGNTRSYTNVKKILRHWLRTHPPDSFDEFEVPSPKHVEVPFAFPMFSHRGWTVWFTGRIDIVGRSRGPGRKVVIVDHKVSVYWPSLQGWVDSWDLKSQFRGYAWAAQQITGEIPDVLINAIQIFPVPKGTQMIKNKKTGEKDYKKCSRPSHAGDYLKDCGVRHGNHFTVPLHLLQEDLDEWRQEFEATCKDYIDLMIERPRISDARSARRQGISRGMCGLFSCDLTTWCQAHRRKNLMDAHLKIHEWSPLDWTADRPVVKKLKV